jgi:periplasmic divalent cation tolerance protein
MSTADILLVYITCKDIDQAKSIGQHLMSKRLCACANIIPGMQSMFFWPPQTNQVDESNEIILIAKTIESRYKDLESEVARVHSYDVPCIIAIPTAHVSQSYYDWLLGELNTIPSQK